MLINQKKDSGFILVNIIYIIMLVSIILLTWFTLSYYFNKLFNNRTTNNYSKIRLEEEVMNYVGKTFSTKYVGIGYYSITSNNFNIKIDKYDDELYIIYIYNMNNPNLIYYQIFHNGIVDKTDYCYYILKEGYLE